MNTGKKIKLIRTFRGLTRKRQLKKRYKKRLPEAPMTKEFPKLKMVG